MPTPTRGKYTLSRLTQRVDQCQMPLIRIVDLRQERRKEKAAAILSDKLRSAIADRLARHEQTILFLNRRGFSTSLLCSQLRQSARLPKLQRRAHLSSQQRATQLPSLRTQRGRARNAARNAARTRSSTPASARKKWRRTSRQFFQKQSLGAWTPTR